VTSLNVLGLSDRLLVIGHGLRFYFIKSIAPLNLAPLYDLTAQIDNIKEHIFFNYLFLIILSLFLFLLRKRLPGLFYAVLAGLLALFPVSGIMQAGPQIAADRFTYLPFMAIAIFIGGSVVFLLNSNFFKKYLISVRFIVIAGLIFSLIMLSNITRMQIEFWKDSISIWQHTVSLFPESGIARHHLGMAYNNIGNAFSRKGDHEMAIKNLKLAIESNPDYFEAYFNLANAFVLKSEFDEAIKYYQLLINDNPIYEPAYINLGVALFRAGDTKGALKVYEDALSKNPDFSGVRSNLTKMKKGLGISD
jgi:tetratricopeptide (TPR) repeat protein